MEYRVEEDPLLMDLTNNILVDMGDQDSQVAESDRQQGDKMPKNVRRTVLVAID